MGVGCGRDWCGGVGKRRGRRDGREEGRRSETNREVFAIGGGIWGLGWKKRI